MKQLSLTQQYLLCALNQKGKLSTFCGMEKLLCLPAAAVLELLMDDVLAFDGKKLTTQRPLPPEKDELNLVYEWIKQKQPVKFERVVEYFSFTITSKRINGLIDAVGRKLVQAGCVTPKEGGLLGEKTLYQPKEEAVDAIVQSIRAEILEEGPLSEEIVALTALLNKSNDLKMYFSPYEKKALNQRLKEIKKDPQNQMIQRVCEYIDTLLVMIVVAST